MADEAANVVEIRKYPNRRYYDTSRSTHVTLEEIYSIIRDGREIRVIDSKSDEDITAKVLAQIILDLDAPKLGIFPVPLLHRLIRSNEQIVNDFVDKYFNKALNAFLDSQRGFEQYLRQAMGLQSPPTDLTAWTKMVWGPLAPWAAGQDPTPAAGETSPASTNDKPPAPENGQGAAAQGEEDLRKVIDQLRQQLADVQQQKAAPRSSAGKKPRKRARRPAP